MSSEEVEKGARQIIREKVLAVKANPRAYPEGVDWEELREREPALGALTHNEFESLLAEVVRHELMGEPAGILGPSPEDLEGGA